MQQTTLVLLLYVHSLAGLAHNLLCCHTVLYLRLLAKLIDKHIIIHRQHIRSACYVYHLIVTSWYRYRNRGFWLMSFYWLTFGHDTIMILITIASVLSHTQYVVTMAQAVCAALNIRFFTIPWHKDN